MLKVCVRFDKVSDEKTLKLNGYAEKYPEVGKEFSFYVLKKKDRIIIELGNVYNIKSYGDMLLVQTDLVVAEVWIISGEAENNAEILPFVKDRNTLFLKDGKITSLRKGPSVRGSFSRIRRLLDLMKEDQAFSREKFKLTLVREDQP